MTENLEPVGILKILAVAGTGVAIAVGLKNRKKLTKQLSKWMNKNFKR